MKIKVFIIALIIAQGTTKAIGLELIDAIDSTTRIANALISNPRSLEYCSTNEKGFCTIRVELGDSIKIEAIGYSKKHLLVENLKPKIIYLEPIFEELKDVIVTPNKKIFHLLKYPVKHSNFSWNLSAGAFLVYKIDSKMISRVVEVRFRGKVIEKEAAAFWIFSDSMNRPYKPLIPSSIPIEPNKGKNIIVDLSENPISTNGNVFYVGIEFKKSSFEHVYLEKGYTQPEVRLYLTNRVEKPKTFWKFPPEVSEWKLINNEPFYFDRNLIVQLKYVSE